MANSSNLQAQIDALEIKVCFQEHTIEELNDALTAQQQQIEKMQRQMVFLVDKLKAMAPSHLASQAEETPPPHY